MTNLLSGKKNNYQIKRIYWLLNTLEEVRGVWVCWSPWWGDDHGDTGYDTLLSPGEDTPSGTGKV